MFENLKKVEIEIQSYCNRKCEWCPNIKFDRTHKLEMSDETFLSVINNLRENGYNKGMISFSRYNEPFYNINLLRRRINQVRNELPGIKLVANTNGDYLKRSSLNDLMLNELTIMDYDNKGLGYVKSKFKMLNIPIESINRDYVIGYYGITRVRYMYNWPEKIYLEDRGGFLNNDIFYKSEGRKVKMKWAKDRTVRNYPCHEPNEFIAIDYNGNVMPCCHLRSDNPNHNKYILGNVNSELLSKIYHNKQSINFRKRLSSLESSFYPETCKNCHKKRGKVYE